MEPKASQEDAQSGSGDAITANAPKEAATSKSDEPQIELIVEGEEEPVNWRGSQKNLIIRLL